MSNKMMCKLYNHLQTFYDGIKNNNYINRDLNKRSVLVCDTVSKLAIPYQ